MQTVLGHKLTITWKLHIVCAHLEPLLTQLGRGLAIYAEQAGEAVHYNYNRTKSRYQRNKYHPKHGEKGVMAVSIWSTWNVLALNKTSIQIYREKAHLKRKQ